MKKLTLLIIVCILISMCTNNTKNSKYKLNESETDSVYTKCIKKGGKEFFFNYDDFSSEGAEGYIFFANDTLLSKIKYSYATSMVYVEQEYLFTDNNLYEFKNKIHYIHPEKLDYIEVDSVLVKGIDIFTNNNFKNSLFERLLITAGTINPCWSIKSIGNGAE